MQIPKEKINQLFRTFAVSWKLTKLVWQSEKWILLANFTAVLIPAIVPFVSAYIFKLVIDSVAASLNSGVIDYDYIFGLLGLAFVVSYIQRMSFSVQDYITKIMYTKIPLTIGQKVIEKVSSLDLQYFENSDFHDKLQKVRESAAWRPQEMMMVILFAGQSLLQLVISLYAIVTLNVYLALLITIVAIPSFVNQLLFSRFSWSIWNKNTPFRKKFNYLSDIVQKVESVKELKIFNLRNLFLQETKQIQTDFFKENQKVVSKQLGVNTIFNLLDTVVLAGIMVFVILEALAKRITIGDISFYQSVISNFTNGIGGLFRNLSRVFDLSQYVETIFEILDTKPIITSPENPVVVDFNKTPKIEFKDMSFKYDGQDKFVFHHFNLTINPGEKIALVGENGAGKTTLIKLLLRYYDVTEGEILINGTNLKQLSLEDWYKTIGVLFQDFIKYQYPVKDNIFFGRVWEKKNLEMIIKAAKSAGSHEMIQKFDKEYEQMLGKTFEGGVDLSGGQWQKVALARAFFRNAPVLVLDEPTASIDAKAEAEIFNQVEKLSKDKTVIIISHRFSTVRNANTIYVIDSGRIIESGSHAHLMKQNGQYATLFKLQAKGYQ